MRVFEKKFFFFKKIDKLWAAIYDNPFFPVFGHFLDGMFNPSLQVFLVGAENERYLKFWEKTYALSTAFFKIWASPTQYRLPKVFKMGYFYPLI